MGTLQGIVDIAIAWNWEYDRDFIDRIISGSHTRGLTTYLVNLQNLEETLLALKNNTLGFRFVLDRASDEDDRFLPLAHLLDRRRAASSLAGAVCVINPLDLLRRASDKATMHLEFLSRGLFVPYTIIVSPFNHKREVELSLSELALLGRPFIIKPANTTGGGIGVVTGAESLKDVIETRQHHKNDKYLLQEKVVPADLDGRRAWFRVFFSFGIISLCWWDDRTHLYEELIAGDEQRFELQPLRSIAATIREISGLDFFSTEVAVTVPGKFVVVDYVNEICDMRLQSKYVDGVPDAVVQRIADALVEIVVSSSNSTPL